MDLMITLSHWHSVRFSYSSLSHTLYLISRKRHEIFMFLTGDPLQLMNTTICSTRLLVLMDNSHELITCLTSIQVMAKMLLIVWELRCQFTFQDCTTMTISGISARAMLKENLTMSRLILSHVSQYLGSGRLTGIRDTRCQLSTIFFRAMISRWNTC